MAIVLGRGDRQFVCGFDLDLPTDVSASVRLVAGKPRCGVAVALLLVGRAVDGLQVQQSRRRRSGCGQACLDCVPERLSLAATTARKSPSPRFRRRTPRDRENRPADYLGLSLLIHARLPTRILFPAASPTKSHVE